MSGPPVRISGLALSWAAGVGISNEALARASGVALEALEAGTLLDYEDALKLWEGLEKLAGDPYVGLHAGERFRLDQMGMVGPAFAHARDVSGALDVLARLMPLLMRNIVVERVDVEDVSGIRYRTPLRRSRHGPDAIFAATLAVLRDSTGAHVVPARVELEVPAPADPDVYERSFGVRPCWDAPANALLFSRADLERPMRGAAPAVSQLLVDHAPSLLTKGHRSAFEVEIERAYWAAHRARGATLASTARELKISARTLQRRLTENRMTFAELRAELLKRRARELLDDHTWSIEAIAEELGYATRASFERAYLRWHGTTPAADRKR